jgi:F0F1-type ATP synthase membrane subunit b/b'
MENVTFFPNHLKEADLAEADLAELLAEMRDWGQQIVDQANVLLEEKENH